MASNLQTPGNLAQWLHVDVNRHREFSYLMLLTLLPAVSFKMKDVISEHNGNLEAHLKQK